MIEITGALEGARALLGLARVAIDARDDAKLKEALTGLQEKLNDVTTAALASIEKAAALQEQLTTAKSEKAHIEAKLNERGAYALVQIRPGTFAYAAQATDGDANPPHYLCQICFDAGQKVVLQRPSGSNRLLCNANPHHHIRVADDAPLRYTRGTRGREHDPYR